MNSPQFDQQNIEHKAQNTTKHTATIRLLYVKPPSPKKKHTHTHTHKHMAAKQRRKEGDTEIEKNRKR